MSFLSRSFLFLGSSLVVGALGACGSTTTPPAEASRSDVPASDVPASDVPAIDVPASDAPASDVATNDHAASDAPAADAPASDVPVVDAPRADGSMADAAPVDSGLRGCASASNCVSGMEECVFPEGSCASSGSCTFISDCAKITEYCSCAGETFRSCPGRPTRSNSGRGPCTGGDGGVSDVAASDGPLPDASICAGASIGPGGRYCAGPADGALPISCCTGWVCDSRVVLCASLPPACAPGEVPSVVSACWGPCVPATNCAHFACGDAACPRGFMCNPSSLECDPVR